MEVFALETVGKINLVTVKDQEMESDQLESYCMVESSGDVWGSQGQNVRGHSGNGGKGTS